MMRSILRSVCAMSASRMSSLSMTGSWVACSVTTTARPLRWSSATIRLRFGRAKAEVELDVDHIRFGRQEVLGQSRKIGLPSVPPGAHDPLVGLRRRPSPTSAKIRKFTRRPTFSMSRRLYSAMPQREFHVDTSATFGAKAWSRARSITFIHRSATVAHEKPVAMRSCAAAMRSVDRNSARRSHARRISFARHSASGSAHSLPSTDTWLSAGAMR